MGWLYYLIEANLYLLIFYGFYKLFLQHETFYNSNRYYLLLSSITAFILPILQLGYLKPAPITTEILLSPAAYDETYLNHVPLAANAPIEQHLQYSDFIYPFYLFIALCFALKLSLGLSKIIKLWLGANKTNTERFTLIELKEQTAAFSFFNLLFIHPNLADQPAVLKHELVHIKQKHSIDILFFELLQIVCWFNPFLILIKRDVKLLHEYIADELTTNSDIQKHEYALFLIQNSFGLSPNPLTNQIFNQSILKRRINMLNKKRTAAWAKLRLLLVLPLSGTLLCVSTMAFTKDYGYVDLLPEKSKATNTKLSKTSVLEKVAQKTDTIKWKQAQPIKLKIATTFIPIMDRDTKTGKLKSLEQRYIIINDKKVENQQNFYGVTNAQKIVRLSPGQAQKKYGQAAKNGAVEITGAKIKWLTASDVPPQLPPKVDQIKFPPPIVRPDVQTRFSPRHEYSQKTDKMAIIDNRYIIINGTPVADNSTFFGVTNTESVSYLAPAAAIKAYGEDKGKNGAVIIKGSNIKYMSEIKSPPPVEPPPPMVEQIRFSPPKKGAKSKQATKKTLQLKIKEDVPVEKVQLNEDIAKLVDKLPSVVVAQKEGNQPKKISKEEVAKLIQKLPAITVADRDSKLSDVKIIIDKKNP